MPSTFNEKSKQPDDASLAGALGGAKRHWDGILERLARQCEGLGREWKFYGQKLGWQLKLTHQKRALMYLIPHEGSFTAALALNEHAVAAVRESELPAALIEEIVTAKVFAEGRPARVKVSGKKRADSVSRLLEIKLRG